MSINRSKMMDLHGRVVELDGVTIELIQRVVAKSFHQPVSIMTSKDKSRSKAWPRMIAMALSRELTIKGLVQIGHRFGGRDHTTIYNAVKVVKDQCDVSPDTAKLVSELRELLSKRKSNQ